jgi:hypothetical protein
MGVYNIPFHPYSLQANSDSFVVKTLDRKTLWEMQTPQVFILLILVCILCFFVPALKNVSPLTFFLFLEKLQHYKSMFSIVGYEAQFTQRWF